MRSPLPPGVMEELEPLGGESGLRLLGGEEGEARPRASVVFLAAVATDERMVERGTAAVEGRRLPVPR